MLKTPNASVIRKQVNFVELMRSVGAFQIGATLSVQNERAQNIASDEPLPCSNRNAATFNANALHIQNTIFLFWACLCGSLPFKRSQCMRVHYICVRTGRTLLDNIRVCCAVFFYFLRIVRVTAAKAKCKCRCRVTRETRFTHKTPQNRKQLRKNSF